MTEAQERLAQNVVTGENLQEFQLKRMGLDIPTFTEPKIEEDTGDTDASSVLENALNADSDNDIDDVDDVEVKKVENKKNSYIRLREQRNEARQANEALKAEIEALKKAPKDEVKAPDATAKPKPSDFTDAFEYAEKLSEWSAEEALRKQAKSQAEAKEKEQILTAQQAWNKKVEAVLEEYPDYHDMTDDLVLPNTVVAALRESDIGPRIGVYLAENPEELDKLKGLTAVGQVKFIDRLETKLSPKVAKEPDVKPVARSKAPEPVRHVKPSSSIDGVYDANGDFTGTPAQWRELRKSGKIK